MVIPEPHGDHHGHHGHHADPCFEPIKSNPHDRFITILTEEVKYDVKFDTWLREKVTNREMHNANKEAEKVGYAYSDDRAEDWLCRQIETAMDNVRAELNWCVVDEDTSVTNEIPKVPTEWFLHLHFNKNWAGNLRAMKTALHKYVVEYVLAQWYRASMPNGSDRYMYEADKWLDRLYEEARSERVEYRPWTL